MRPDLPTDSEQWERVEALFDEALELPAGERRAFLDQACAGNPELRARVEALLAADEEAGGFLATPAHQAAAALLAEASSEEPLVGQELGPYRLLRQIGSGGMGVVYEAEDARLRRRVAIKLLPPELSRDPAAKERFLREARAASALDDPNICTVHDIGESDGRLYIVMAFYEGETLKERLQRGPLPAAEARQVAIQVCRALVRSHGAGIVHRDIKPANVMITGRGEVKVLDFGIAKVKGDASMTRTGDSPGTPAYMSPEQARGAPVDGRTDLWALGAVLYEMLAGRRAFPADDRAVVFSILNREPEPLGRVRPEVPPALAQVVVKALAKSAEARYQTAAELLADLEASSVATPRRRMLRTGLFLAAVLASALIFAAFRGWLPWSFWKPVELRVAVLRPVVTSVGKNPEVAFVASEVVDAAIEGLLSFEGLRPIDPPEPDEKKGSEVERRRSADADEVLSSRLSCAGRWCRMTLRRLRGDEVLATAKPFHFQVGVENAFQLDEGILVSLEQVYSGRSSSPGTSKRRVKPQDYAEYIAFERRVDGGKSLGAEELVKLDALLHTSPDLLGAYLLAAGIARRQRDFDRALGYAERAAARAEELARHDPRPLFTRLRIEVEGNQLDAAQVTLVQLADLAPGDVRVMSAEADLLEARGKLKEALVLRRKVAERRPTWRAILDLAVLETNLGESDSARRRLGALLKEQPNNQYAREHLARLEGLSGDLKRASALYEELIAAQPTRTSFTNLGFVRYLLGDPVGAAEAYRQALVLEPDHLSTRFSLAAALEAGGDKAQARRFYRTLAKELQAAPRLPDARTRMLHAQCLARLGKSADAARLAEEVLEQTPEDIQVINQAAQLYAILGDGPEALHYTKRALKKGLRREWLTIPEFDSLKNNPEFQKLLASRPSGKV
ncbi:MAG TPA: protein kinase [Thermoanaerobaculia bacterium]|nr:protein kinase [Thermoanaerobaculia bacterium]